MSDAFIPDIVGILSDYLGNVPGYQRVSSAFANVYERNKQEMITRFNEEFPYWDLDISISLFYMNKMMLQNRISDVIVMFSLLPCNNYLIEQMLIMFHMFLNEDLSDMILRRCGLPNILSPIIVYTMWRWDINGKEKTF